MIQIFPTSLEWSHIRFRVQLMLADPSVELLKVYKYPNQLQQKYLNYMKIDCAVNATNMEYNDLEMLKYGNSSKFVFEAGHMKLENQTSNKKQGSKSKFDQIKNKILLFKLAIDQSMPIHKSGLSQLEKLTQFPLGIDTIYISQNKEQLNIYPHKYRVKDKSQCCLQYQIDFVCRGIQSVDKWTSDQLMCQNCQVTKALYYCPQDKEIFCGKCYDQLHRSTKKRSHQKNTLTPFNSASFCPFHSKFRQTHYCLQCMDLKCQDCIKNQSHKNEKKHTQIMLLPELEQTLKQKQTAFIKQAKQRTKVLIIKAESTMGKINKEYEHQRNLLQQQFTTKLVKIRDQVNKKSKRLVALHTQLKRKYDQLLWVQNFLNYCQDFLLAQSNIQMKNSFFVYLQGITVRQYYQQIDKKIDEVN